MGLTLTSRNAVILPLFSAWLRFTGRFFALRPHRDLAASATNKLERDVAFCGGKDREILADICARASIKLISALAHDNIAGDDEFAAEALHAQALGLAITPVAAGASTFLVSHNSLSSQDYSRLADAFDTQTGISLPMPTAAAIAQTRAIFPDKDFLGAVMLDHGCRDHSALDERTPDERRSVVGHDQQHGVEIKAGTGFHVQFFNVNDFAGFHAILASTRPDNSVHNRFSNLLFSPGHQLY